MAKEMAPLPILFLSLRKVNLQAEIPVQDGSGRYSQRAVLTHQCTHLIVYAQPLHVTSLNIVIVWYSCLLRGHGPLSTHLCSTTGGTSHSSHLVTLRSCRRQLFPLPKMAHPVNQPPTFTLNLIRTLAREYVCRR